ncbi:hypothetical protein DSM104299_02306 [Baekduia alba]|uniref:TOMM precursor leader peptide-binding protein n=1 Tax=Baekduia alba TaxID=2997333 RepID=UPI002341D470|nr:TOMM precursor leader peptide-binding protein [Baekduia alba]WCB93593.1 hypothetical protein DSM104299_02306 [Baekduia alba]
MTDRDRVVLLRHGHRGGDIALEGDPAVLVELLAQLDGTRGREEILAALRAGPVPALSAADLDEALDAMAADAITEDASEDPRHLDEHALDRYDRQLRYFSDLAPAGMPRAAAQARLESATVAVLGLGGLGGLAATMLAAVGIGTIVGVDHDDVELSNLARQILYREDDLGRPKVEAAAEHLGQLNGRTTFRGIAQRLESTEDVARVIAGTDFVVGAVDWPATQISHWVNAACWDAEIPYISMSIFPPLLRVGPTYVPGVTGCRECQETAYRRIYPLYDKAMTVLDSHAPGATYAPSCGVIGSLIANEVVAYITGLHPLTCEGNAFMIDTTTLTVTREAVPRDPDCPVCGTSTMRPPR